MRRRAPRLDVLLVTLPVLGLAAFGLARPGPVAAQLPPGEIVTASRNLAALLRVNPLTGAKSLLAEDVSGPISITLGPGDDIYVLLDTGQVVRVTPAGEKQPVGFAPGLPQDIVTGRDGSLYILSEGNFNDISDIHRMDPQSGLSTLFAGDVQNAHDMAVAPDGDLIVSGTCPGVGSCLMRINSLDERSVVVSGNPLNTLEELGVGPDGTIYFTPGFSGVVCALGQNCLYRVDGDTVTPVTAFGPDQVLRKLAVDSTGRPLIVCQCTSDGQAFGQGIVAVDPTTGAQSIIILDLAGAALPVDLNGDILVAPGVPGPQPPVVALQLNQMAFRAGDTLVLTGTLTPGTDAGPVDVYVALELPDDSLLSVTGGGIVGGLAPIAANLVPLPFAGEVFRYTVTGLEPAGSYRWRAGLTRPGTLDVIGVIHDEPFTVGP